MPRPADRRAKIALLRAAEAVFVEHGLPAAKVEEITARAGVSKGAFYLHFASKEDCFRQIVEGFLAKLASCLDEAPPTAEVKGANAFAAHLAGWLAHDIEIFDFCWQNRGLMGILFSGGGAGTYGYLMDEFAERCSEQVEVWVRHLVRVGIYRPDVDPEVLPALLAGGYERMIRAMIKRTKRPDIEAWARQALDLYMRGVLTDEARAVLDQSVMLRNPVGVSQTPPVSIGNSVGVPQTPPTTLAGPVDAAARTSERLDRAAVGPKTPAPEASPERVRARSA
jgi:AcrR family transcriptional regulator